MVQFETPVRWMKEWMDGKTKEGTSLFIFVFCFLGVQTIKYGIVVDEEMELLSIHIINWRSLARRLQFSEMEMAQFDKGNENVSETVYTMLMAWKHREGSLATYGVLYDALCHPLVNRHDLAYKFCIAASSSLVSTLSSRVVTQFSQIL